ncbi:MAG: 1-deoxy-D-xylulose-5-phosphate synthase, partial [Firmicutes bacterium]|nr:1-deoxy-D-xylulose-5-phosphate synthase [Bacillota bacterium]
TKSCDYAEIFGKELVSLAKENSRIVAITAAMPVNTGLSEFASTFKKRYFDVGIAEEHAVTMAAGLAISGFVPVLPIYSTFLQRAYDQILHDVCLQNLHVVLCAEHSGIVGEDGETHHGMYDTAFLSQMPNMTLLSPSSFNELKDMLDYAINIHNGPIAIRYPKGSCQVQAPPFEFGKAQILKDGKDILIISTGRMIKTAEAVAEHFGAQLISLATIKPLDTKTVIDNAKDKKLIVTIEDAAKSGGINAIISCAICENSINAPILPFAFPNAPIVHGTIDELDKFYGMDENSIIKRIEEHLNDFKTKT